MRVFFIENTKGCIKPQRRCYDDDKNRKWSDTFPNQRASWIAGNYPKPGKRHETILSEFPEEST